ncbi:MAG: hypothetical protein ACO1OO_17050 [Flavisolibacter sp.]
MKKMLCLLLLPALLVACKGRKKEAADPAEFIPITSFFRGQVAQMDSSTATILKIEKSDTSRPDTTYLRREEFKTWAKPFLDLPEISDEKWRDDYEVTNMYDDLMKAYIFTYTTQEEDAEIKKQDVIVEPDAEGNNNIRAVNIDKWSLRGKTVVQQNMLWETGSRFLIVTKVSQPGEAEKIKTLEVKWMEKPQGF